MAVPPSDIALMRLALVTFTPKPNGWRAWTTEIDGVDVTPISAYELDRGLKLLVSATVELRHRPKVTSSGHVVVPPKARAMAERAIEFSANLVAVAQGCRRSIASPWPPVVLVPRGEEALKWLDGKSGILRGRLKHLVGTRDRLDLDEAVLNQLGDRDDGVALLVEAFAHTHAMGRFHEFMRLFERAFALPAPTLAHPLSLFLNPRFGYDEMELTNWFEVMRGPATHADQRSEFLLEADVRSTIDRIEQAAIDVLLNKTTWRDPATDRRELWVPRTGTRSAAGDVFIVKGTRRRLSGRFLDEYDAFPMDLQGVIKSRPPHWWPQTDAASSKSETFEVKVTDEL
jgi:hypothetical protein